MSASIFAHPADRSKTPHSSRRRKDSKQCRGSWTKVPSTLVFTTRPIGGLFVDTTSYDATSPHSATEAASDHSARVRTE